MSDPVQNSGGPQQGRPPVNPGAALTPPPPPQGGYAYPPPPSSGSRTSGVMARVMTGLLGTLLLVSILLNVYLGIFFVSITRGPAEEIYEKGDQKHRIVILPIRGTIDDKTAEFIRKSLQHLRENKPAAIILRVESGGGLVSASDQIWHELTRFKTETKIPIVASFGSVAASGGYYVAMPSDYIFAEVTTITGSIGVIVQAFTVQNLLDKIGVTPEIITSSESTKKDKLIPFRAWTEDDRGLLRELMDAAYDRFHEVVKQGRPALTDSEVDDVSHGAVFTAAEAIKRKLVDEQGYLDAAIEKAKSLANIDAKIRPHVTTLGPARGVLSMLQGSAPQPGVSGFQLDTNELRRMANDMLQPTMHYVWIPTP